MDPSTNPQCLQGGGRPAETDADQALVANGWTLFSGYMAGWNTVVVRALSGYDGMCRPLGYNAFVFVDGQFAGTISPDVMDLAYRRRRRRSVLFRQGRALSRFPAVHAHGPAVLSVGPCIGGIPRRPHTERSGGGADERYTVNIDACAC
jgi:hypothetical protein